MSLGRLDAIDALRATAMLGVVAQHCGIFPAGWVGVWLFYVISGYVIARGISKDDVLARPFGSRYARFMFMRATRIVPALVVYLGLCALVAAAIGAVGFFVHLPYLAAFVFNWRMIFMDWSAIGMWAPIGHLWTISVEQQFYLLFPFLAMLAPTVWRVRLCVFFIVLALFARAVAGALLAHAGGKPLENAFAIYASTYGHVDAFLVGALIAYRQEWFAEDPRRARRLGYLAVAAALIYFVAYLGTNLGSGARGPDALRNIYSGILFGQGREVFVYSVVVGLAAWLVATAAVGSPSSVAPATRGRAVDALAWIGRRSYSGYLVHTLAIWCVGLALGPSLDPLGIVGKLLVFLVVSVTTLVAAHAMYEWVEQPVLRWARGKCFDAPGATLEGVVRGTR